MIEGKYFNFFLTLKFKKMKTALLKTVLLVLVLYASTPLYAAKPFVEWPGKTDPMLETPQKLFRALQTAATGRNDILKAEYAASVVYSNAAAYQKVWSSDPGLWQEVVSAGMDQFKLGYSQGGELNYGIEAGVAIPLEDRLKPNVPVVIFTRKNGQRIEIAKWGTNGCLNALCHYLTPAVAEKPWTDPDGDPNWRPKDTTVIIKETIIKEVASEKKELTFKEGYEIYKLGQYDTYVAEMKAMDLAAYSKMLQTQSGNCNSCATTSSTPVFATTMAAPAPQVAYYPQQRRFIETFAGQATANAVGTAAGIGIAALASNLFGGGIQQVGVPIYQGGIIQGTSIGVGPVSPTSGYGTIPGSSGIVSGPTLGVGTSGVFTATGNGMGGFNFQ